MAINYAGPRTIISQKALNGGLNTAAGPLGVADNEASDIQNIDFNKFGSILKRSGYTKLNSAAITNTPQSDGLHWYEYTSSGATVRNLINITDGKFYKMDGLDGTWDDVSGSVTITSSNFCDFENFLNTVLVTNNENPPFQWTGSGNAAVSTVPTDLTKAKFVVKFQNYAFYLNTEVSGTRHGSRYYWSGLNTISTWNAADFDRVGKDDGQEITGARVLGEFLIIFKERSIYKIAFTGDRDIPFVKDKTASSVGCVAPWSIQEVDNGIVFLSYDGLYFFDGNNSFKISDRINPTITGFNRDRFDNAVSLVQKDKNRYLLGVTSSGQSTNDTVVVWDYFNNAFSLYDGIDASAMVTVYVNGVEERPYFADYAGFVFRADTGTSDNGVAIDGYYKTNWKTYDDLVDDKGVAHVYIYHQLNNSTLSMGYAYDFEGNDSYTQSFSIGTSTDVYDTGIYGTATYAGEGGSVRRRDLTGRGKVVRVNLSNNILNEGFQIDGIGTIANAETYT